MFKKMIFACSLFCVGMLGARAVSTTTVSPKQSWWFLKNNSKTSVDVEITPHAGASNGTLTASPASGGAGTYNTRKPTKAVTISDIEPGKMAVMALKPNADAMYFMNVEVKETGKEKTLAEKGIKVQPDKSYHVALNVGKNIEKMNYDDLATTMNKMELRAPTQKEAPKENHNNGMSIEKAG